MHRNEKWGLSFTNWSSDMMTVKEGGFVFGNGSQAP